MTANRIALMCDHYLTELVKPDADEKALENYNRATTLLETYIKLNFLTFEQTELVYTFAKNLCDTKNDFLNRYRMSGYDNMYDFGKRLEIFPTYYLRNWKK